MPVTDIESIWLYTKAADLNEIKNYASYVFNFRDVHATTSISTMTIGGMNNRMGFVGTAIKEYAYNDATGNFHLGNLPPDYANNSIRVDRCAFITFALNVAYGEAWALANVYYFTKPKAKSWKGIGNTKFSIIGYDRLSGDIKAQMKFAVDPKAPRDLVSKVFDRNVELLLQEDKELTNLDFVRSDQSDLLLVPGQKIRDLKNIKTLSFKSFGKK